MSDINKNLQSLWKNQTTQIGDIDVELVKKNSLKFERTIMFRNLREAAAGIFVAVMFTKTGLEQESLFKQIVNYEIALAGIFVSIYMYYFSIKNRVQEDGSSTLEYIEKYKKSLKAQIKLLGSVRYWYVLPIAAGLFTLHGYDIYQAIKGNENITYLLLSLGFCLTISLFVIWLNEYKGVRYLKEELDSLN